jgi:hypothetical protein
VLLVILIFLMVSTTYSKFTELQITLPTADAQKATEKPFELNVTVDAKGNYTINGEPVSFRDVAALRRRCARRPARAARRQVAGGDRQRRPVRHAPDGDQRDGSGAPGRLRETDLCGANRWRQIIRRRWNPH